VPILLANTIWFCLNCQYAAPACWKPLRPAFNLLSNTSHVFNPMSKCPPQEHYFYRAATLLLLLFCAGHNIGGMCSYSQVAESRRTPYSSHEDSGVQFQWRNLYLVQLLVRFRSRGIDKPDLVCSYCLAIGLKSDPEHWAVLKGICMDTRYGALRQHYPVIDIFLYWCRYLHHSRRRPSRCWCVQKQSQAAVALSRQKKLWEPCPDGEWHRKLRLPRFRRTPTW